MKSLLVLSIVGFIHAQYFECPQHTDTILSGQSIGNIGCSDNPGEDAPPCLQLVTPNTWCTIMVSQDDQDNSDFVAEVHIYAENISRADRIIIASDFDSQNSDSTTLRFRAAYSSNNHNGAFFEVHFDAGRYSNMKFGWYIQRNPAPQFLRGTTLSSLNAVGQFIQTKEAQYGDYWDIISTSKANGFSLEIDGNFTIVYVLQTTDIFDGLIILSDVSNMSCSEVFDGSVYPLITWLPSQGALMVTTFNQPVICLDDSTNWIILYWKILIHPVDDKSPAFLNSFSFPGYNYTIYVYAGAIFLQPEDIPAEYLIATYTNVGDFTLPQRLTTFATTIIIKTQSPVGYIETTTQEDDFDATPGRKNYLTTPGYPFNMTGQDADLILNSTAPFNLTYTVINSFDPKAEISVYGSQDILWNGISVNGSLSFVDTSIRLIVKGSNETSGGVYLTYSISDPSTISSTTNPTTTILTTASSSTMIMSSVTVNNSTTTVPASTSSINSPTITAHVTSQDSTMSESTIPSITTVTNIGPVDTTTVPSTTINSVSDSTVTISYKTTSAPTTTTTVTTIKGPETTTTLATTTTSTTTMTIPGTTPKLASISMGTALNNETKERISGMISLILALFF